MGVPANLLPKASLFLHAIGFGMPAVTMYAALRGYSEALGHPRPVTVISLAALVLLVPLNFVFMYGFGPIPALGSAGCGFATALIFLKPRHIKKLKCLALGRRWIATGSNAF